MEGYGGGLVWRKGKREKHPDPPDRRSLNRVGEVVGVGG